MAAQKQSPLPKRRILFVDPKVQTALLVRAVMYWVFTVLAMTLMLLCWRIITGPARIFYTHFDDMWFHYGPALGWSLVLLPIVLVDVLKVSNRFVGPLVRLRRGMRALAAGEHVNPIHFREGDFWHDIAEEFNAVLARVQREQGAPPSAHVDEELVAASTD